MLFGFRIDVVVIVVVVEMIRSISGGRGRLNQL